MGKIFSKIDRTYGNYETKKALKGLSREMDLASEDMYGQF
jgi:hypothetical protein